MQVIEITRWALMIFGIILIILGGALTTIRGVNLARIRQLVNDVSDLKRRVKKLETEHPKTPSANTRAESEMLMSADTTDKIIEKAAEIAKTFVTTVKDPVLLTGLAVIALGITSLISLLITK